MPIRTHISSDSNITIHTVTGEVEFEEAMATFEDFYAGNPTMLVLWDFSAGSLVKISTSQFRMITEFLARVSVKRKGGKTAGVFSKDVDFGLGRMLESFCNIGGYSPAVSLFHTIDDAVNWLTSHDGKQS